MAKIRPAGKKKEAGPKNPGAWGCIILLGSAFLLILLVLYYSLARH